MGTEFWAAKNCYSELRKARICPLSSQFSFSRAKNSCAKKRRSCWFLWNKITKIKFWGDFSSAKAWIAPKIGFKKQQEAHLGRFLSRGRLESRFPWPWQAWLIGLCEMERKSGSIDTNGNGEASHLLGKLRTCEAVISDFYKLISKAQGLFLLITSLTFPRNGPISWSFPFRKNFLDYFSRP